jgi:hypothetical protein
MSTVKANAIIDASGGNTATINSMTPTADSLQGFRNRIINGNMRIDQRNAGAAVTANDSYTVDRFLNQNDTDGTFSAQQDSSAPAGFVNSLKFTTTAADASLAATQRCAIQHRIEGYNVSDLGWGTADAKTVTLSFWVKSTLTGTFGGALQNSAANRSYPFSYTISVANTWELKSVTVAGDTSGTWLTTNGIGLRVYFGLGMGSTYSGTANAWAAADYRSPTGAVSVIGTLNATWYVTGVQLEVGSVATPFERRDYGRELAMCQRYYYKQQAADANARFATGYNNQTTTAVAMVFFPASMRTAPTALEQSGTAGDYRLQHQFTSTTCSSVPTFSSADVWGATTLFTVASGLTQGQGSFARSVNSSAYLAWSAEL